MVTRVLHVVSSLDDGGVESLLYNYYNNMDRTKIQFDFIKHDEDVGIFEKKFLEYGSKVYYVIPKKQSFLKNMSQMRKIIKNGKYDIIHCHQNTMSVFPLIFGKFYGIKKRIAHSHVGYINESIFIKIKDYSLKFLIKRLATDYWACSQLAGEWLFGKKSIEKKLVYILNNAIDVKKFVYDEDKRNTIRENLNIENKFVIGNVARFTYQKNHEYLIDIFKEIIAKKSNAILLLAGNGELLEEVKKKVELYNLSKNVVFLGVRNDIPDLMQAMDAFVLPTRFEGLGIVYIEAQAAGLMTYATSDVVPRETNVTDTIRYIKLGDGPKKWADEIIKDINIADRKNNIESLTKNGFNIINEAKKMENEYIKG